MLFFFFAKASVPCQKKNENQDEREEWERGSQRGDEIVKERFSLSGGIRMRVFQHPFIHLFQIGLMDALLTA